MNEQRGRSAFQVALLEVRMALITNGLHFRSLEELATEI